MTGLLYKAFVSINGKKIMVIYLVSAVLIILTRLILGPVMNSFSVMMSSEPGYDPEKMMMMPDLLFWAAGMVLFLIAMDAAGFIAPTKMMEDDRSQSRVFDYIGSLPVKKNTYIASQFVFIGIMIYVVFSLQMILTIIGNALTHNESMRRLWNAEQMIAIPLCCMTLLGVGIDLASAISLGKDRGRIVKTALYLIVGGVVVWCGLFGDIWNINLESIMNWMSSHQFEITLIDILAPVISLALYYLFYRISCRFYNKGVDQIG